MLTAGVRKAFLTVRTVVFFYSESLNPARMFIFVLSHCLSLPYTVMDDLLQRERSLQLFKSVFLKASTSDRDQ